MRVNGAAPVIIEAEGRWIMCVRRRNKL